MVREAPDYAPGHVGLATACGLVYEATALDATPDAGALETALLHARAACKLAPSSGEAWSALAFVLRLSGDAEIAGAAAIKAMHADRQNWRLALRAAYACWGDDRIEAASQLLTLRPGLALGHWFMTTCAARRSSRPDTVLAASRC